MKPYKEFRPTQFDRHINFEDSRETWLILGVSQNRDSDCLTRSNFDAALESLGGESDHVEVHRFGHWGPGWFEIILIDPSKPELVAIGEDIERALANYPVLDDRDFSEKEREEIDSSWDSYGYSHLDKLLQDQFELAENEEFDTEKARGILRQYEHYDILDTAGFHDHHCIECLEKFTQEEINQIIKES